MLRKTFSPHGYRELLVYKKAEELQKHCSLLTSHFPRFSPLAPSVPLKTILSLADQMDRSARSGKQNIVEGWKRNSTNEYHQFLGFSIGANTELEEDCDDIIKGFYPDLMGIKGVMGEKGEMGIRGLMRIEEVERLPFYPLNPHLPPIVQLKLRSKELNYLLSQLQKSLEEKMGNEKTLNAVDKLSKINSQKKQEEKFAEDLAKKYNLPSYN